MSVHHQYMCSPGYSQSKRATLTIALIIAVCVSSFDRQLLPDCHTAGVLLLLLHGPAVHINYSLAIDQIIAQIK